MKNNHYRIYYVKKLKWPTMSVTIRQTMNNVYPFWHLRCYWILLKFPKPYHPSMTASEQLKGFYWHSVVTLPFWHTEDFPDSLVYCFNTFVCLCWVFSQALNKHARMSRCLEDVHLDATQFCMSFCTCTRKYLILKNQIFFFSLSQRACF